MSQWPLFYWDDDVAGVIPAADGGRGWLRWVTGGSLSGEVWSKLAVGRLIWWRCSLDSGRKTLLGAILLLWTPVALCWSWCRVARVLQAGYLFIYSSQHPFWAVALARFKATLNHLISHNCIQTTIPQPQPLDCKPGEQTTSILNFSGCVWHDGSDV